MALPNSFGRRNFGNVGSSTVARNSGLNTQMSRGSFVRGAGLAAGSALAAGLGLGNVASATTTPTPVYPTGNPAFDISAVQAAVNIGGTILMKSQKLSDIYSNPPVYTAFNFGAGKVTILNDVEIIGETKIDDNGELLPDGTPVFPDGAPLTVINGGYPAFMIVNAHVIFKGIHFKNPILSAIFTSSYNGFDLIGNKFTGGTLVTVDPRNPVLSYCIHVWHNSTFPSNPFNLRGPVTVRNNYFDGETDSKPANCIPPGCTPCTSGYTFSSGFLFGIPTYGCYKGASGGVYLSGWASDSSILLEKNIFRNFHQIAAAVSPGKNAVVRYNSIDTGQYGWMSWGLAIISSPGAFVHDNVIEARNTSHSYGVCLALMGADYSRVLNNHLVSNCGYGIYMTPYSQVPQYGIGGDCENNVITGNTIVGSSIVASVMLVKGAGSLANTSPHDNYFGPWTDPVTGQGGPGNVFGPVLASGLGVYVDNGKNNTCSQNDFARCNVPGWVDANGNPLGLGCIWLGSNSEGAKIYEHPKLGTKLFPPGTSMCTQINDDGVIVVNPNYIHLWGNLCGAVPVNKNLAKIRARWEAQEAQLQQIPDSDPSALGYVWNEATQQWELPVQ